MAAPAPTLEERELALVAREEAVRAQELALAAREEAIVAHEIALEIRASELSVGEDRLLNWMAEFSEERVRHAREVEFLATARDTLRCPRLAVEAASQC